MPSLVRIRSDGQQGRDAYTGKPDLSKTMHVPVVDKDHKPLMPTTPARARKWIKVSRATPFWSKGVFCVRLNVEPSDRKTQPIAVGIDPGSKKEGYTVKACAHIYLNIQADSPEWVKDIHQSGPNKGRAKAIVTRSQMRRLRRYRHTPCRPWRGNRNANKLRIPPTTLARWQWKLNICKWLCKIYPITNFVVEDIKASTHYRGKRWNSSFSPLQVGKDWFYYQLQRLAPLVTYQGYETAAMRDTMRLKKSVKKMADVFEAHCVDAFTLAYAVVGGEPAPDNTQLFLITQIRFHRRQLHRLEPDLLGVRNRYGGTMSAGFKRGSLVRHTQYGLVYVGGWMEKPTKKDPIRKVISLHDIKTGRRLTQNALPTDCQFVAFNYWRCRYAA